MITINPDEISAEAKELVRLTFNPSGSSTVDRLKILAAALIHEYQQIGLTVPGAARSAATAITNLQTASMWGVLAATTQVAAVESKRDYGKEAAS